MNKIKKLLILVVPAMLLLTSCGGNKVVTESSSPDVESYLLAIRADGGYYGNAATNEELIKLGASACNEFSNGQTLIGLVQSIPVQNEEERQFLVSQIAASLAFLCPEYADTAQNEISN